MRLLIYNRIICLKGWVGGFGGGRFFFSLSSIFTKKIIFAKINPSVLKSPFLPVDFNSIADEV